MSDWRLQLAAPWVRVYEATGKHGGGFTPGRQGTLMDLGPAVTLGVLRGAICAEEAISGDKAPSLWAYHGGRVYRFMWDNQGAWHGYPTEEKPPNSVLQKWRENGTINEAEFGKLRRLPGRGG